MGLHWISADLLTQRIIADLPGIDLGSNALLRTLSNSDTVTVTLHLDENTPENWQRAVLEGGAVLACYDDTDPAKAIVWAGYVTASVPDAGSNDVPIGLATFEAVIDRAFVGDTIYLTTQGRNDIIADLMTTWFTPATGIACELAYAGSGPFPSAMNNPPPLFPTAALLFNNTDNASVKQRIDQVAAQLGGQYTVEWAWTADGMGIFPTLVFGDRIGTPAVAPSPGGPVIPSVVFEFPGSLIGFSQTRDYSSGSGANKVTGFSSGQGTTAPNVATAVAPVDGRPTFEDRSQPAASLSPSALEQYVQQRIKVLAPGARPIVMSADTTQAKGRRLGTDWVLGDDLGYSVAASYIASGGLSVKVLSFPGGLSGLGQCIGYQRTETTLRPVVADTSTYVQGVA